MHKLKNKILFPLIYLITKRKYHTETKQTFEKYVDYYYYQILKISIMFSPKILVKF